jgi:membrane protease subunit HflK
MSGSNNGHNPWGMPPGGGSGGRGGGPWGQRPGGGGGPGGPGQMPDIDQIITQMQAAVRRLLPFGQDAGGGRGAALLLIAVAALWAVSGFFRVQPDEVGVVMRFGAYHRLVGPGLNYHLPWPIEVAIKPPVTRINRIEVGFRSGGLEGRFAPGPREASGQRDIVEESLMLTGDENIIDIDFAVFWRIRDVTQYLFNFRAREEVIKAVSESAMREVIGRTPIQPALTELRARIEADVRKETQEVLDSHAAGVEIVQVQLQKVDPPHAVIDSFRDVQRANTDAERLRNEAEAYRNDILPRARGEAARITAEAEGQRQSAIAEANGQAQRFASVLAAYREAKDLTLQRMYLETMQDVLARSQTIVVDENVRGLVPFLPLTGGDRPPLPSAPPNAAQPQGGSR